MLKIYKASAGSGKTYTLAYEYIRNLLGIKAPGQQQYRLNAPTATGANALSNRHRHILAITFTNKATEEMKRRIIDELDALSHMPATLPDGTTAPDANYAKALCEELHCTRADLAAAAANALKQLLYDYHSFNVTTIDSFFQRVLRAFARELDRQGDFNIELNDLSAVQKSVDTMIDDFNNNNITNPRLGQWILNYMMRQLQSGEKTNFFNRKSHLHSLLVGIITRICDEKFKPFAADMKAYLSDPNKLPSLIKKLNARKTSILSSVATDTNALAARFTAEGADLSGLNGKLKVGKLISDFFAKEKIATRKDVFSDTVNDIISGAKDPFTKKWKGTDAHRALFIDYLKRVQDAYLEQLTLDDILKSLDSLGLLGFAWEYLDNFSAEYNTVLLSDTNHLLAKIIGEEEAPFIYERLGMRLNHFLIDEFQDTSLMQWDNIKPLMADGVAYGHDSLIIGDEKQSIYRFRNSDSSLLHEKVARDYFPPATYDTRIFGAGAGQNTNYRSAADVVKFNNTLFERMAPIHGISGFENVVQDIAKTKKEGYVTFTPVAPPSKEDKEAGAETPDAIAIMADNMRRQHNQGNYAWADMAVLVATNAEAATVVDRLLHDFPDIPVLSDEALYVKKSPAIQTIIGVLKILANQQSGRPREDKNDKYPTMARLAMTMSRFEYFRSRGVEVEPAIDLAINDESKGGDYLPVGIDAINAHKPASLTALVEAIIHEQISEPDRATQIAYLNAFQDFVSDYCARYNPSVHAFLDNWEHHKDTLTISSATDTDAVKVMTIHKSKGLEFDCVHIPFGSWKEAGNPRGQWIEFPHIEGVDKEECPPAIFLKLSDLYSHPGSCFHTQYEIDENERLTDTMNMTYVAYTRAGAELSVCYNPDQGMGKFVAEAIALCGHTNDSRKANLKECFGADRAFAMGHPTVKAKTDKKSAADGAIGLTAYNVYFHKGAEVLTRVTDVLDIDKDITEAEAEPDQTPAADFADDEARLRGIRLHDTLSMITRPEDIDQAVMSTTLRERLSPEESAALHDEIAAMLSSPEKRVRRWFVDFDRVLTEQAIYLPDYPQDNNMRRPDRIVFLPDGSVDIIDYKFTAESERRHRRQVAEYVNILTKMGYTRVSGYLWYPLHHKIEKI